MLNEDLDREYTREIIRRLKIYDKLKSGIKEMVKQILMKSEGQDKIGYIKFETIKGDHSGAKERRDK